MRSTSCPGRPSPADGGVLALSDLGPASRPDLGDEDPDSKPTIQRLLPAVFAALAERGLTLAEAMAVLDPDDRDGLRELLASEVQDEYARAELQWLQDMRADRSGRHDQRIEVTQRAGGKAQLGTISILQRIGIDFNRRIHGVSP